VAYLAATLVVVGLGLGSRRYADALPSFVATYAGDTLWALMVYLVLGVVAPSSGLLRRAGLALLISYADEVSQLFHRPWIDAIRSTTLGGLILGYGFLWSDLACYTVGVAAGVSIDYWIRRRPRPAWPLVVYAILYAISLLSLVRWEGIDPTEPLLLLGVFGVGFSGLAWWVTRGVVPRPARVRDPRREGLALLAYLVALAAFVTWGLAAIRSQLPPSWATELLVLAATLTVFVGLPIGLWQGLFRYRLTDLFAIRAGLAGHWRPTLALAGAVLLFQALAGRSRAELVSLHPSGPALAFALLLGFVWLLVDVGVVEEVCFRGFLQTRLAAWMDSELAGLVGASLLFGLVHAPGLYLRPGLTGEAVGTHPSLLLAVGYCIVYTSVAGLFYGTIWLRTRNLWVVAAVHAAQDLLPTVVHALQRGYLGA